MRTCPVCAEKVDALVSYRREKMCNECRAHRRNEDAQQDGDFLDSLAANSCDGLEPEDVLVEDDEQ